MREDPGRRAAGMTTLAERMVHKQNNPLSAKELSWWNLAQRPQDWGSR